MISNMPEDSPTPGGVGIREEGLHTECGMRTAQVSVTLKAQGVEMQPAVLFGGVGSADVLEWTTVGGVLNGRLSQPMTPMIIVSALVPTGKLVRVRVRGLNQFYAHQTEISPWVAAGPLITTAFPLSKVFSLVRLFEYQSINFDIAGDVIAMGTSNIFDPINIADDTEDEDNAVTLLHGENLGIGLPLRISPYGVAQPYAHPEILGDVMGHNPSQTIDDSLPAVAQIGPLTATVAGYTVGVSADGFQGYRDKLGFDSPDSWTTKILKVDGGTFRMGGEVEGAASTPPRNSDILEFSFMVRTALGTRREANPKSTYEYAQE